MTGLDPLSMVCPPGSGCPLSSLSAFGLPEILLWVLSFAVIFGLIVKFHVFSKAPAALISIAVAFLVLMAVPAALITAVATMSTGLLVVAIGFIVIMALIEITHAYNPSLSPVKDKEGKVVGWQKGEDIHPFQFHGTIMIVLLAIIAGVIFVSSGGLALMGVASLPSMIPAFSATEVVLVIAGLAVLWMLYEA